MKKILLAVFLLICICSSSSLASAGWVKGYTKKNGTYVQPYYRTNPNSTKLDNLSCIKYGGSYCGTSSYSSPSTTYKKSNDCSSLEYYYLYTCKFLPLNAEKDGLYSWKCKDGYVKNYLLNTCDKIPNNSYKKTEVTWDCNVGYYKSGTQCLSLCPINSTYNVSDEECYCNGNTAWSERYSKCTSYRNICLEWGYKGYNSVTKYCTN